MRLGKDLRSALARLTCLFPGSLVVKERLLSFEAQEVAS
jgi:hypothetical protein